MNELKPCPFCGSDDVGPITFKGCNGDVWDEFIECGGCGATAETVEAWNSRAERTCHIEGRYGNQYCTCCGEMVGTWDSTSELYIDGNMVELWNYCPNCGAKVVSE